MIQNPRWNSLIIAFFQSLIWIIIARSQYGYNVDFPIVLGVNVYPMIAWTVGLWIGYLLFYRFLKNENKYIQYGIHVVIYWVLLLIMEIVFYHSFGLHNIATAHHAGLPLCDCMHAPHWMQTVYFMMGPVYFALIRLFNSQKFKSFIALSKSR